MDEFNLSAKSLCELMMTYSTKKKESFLSIITLSCATYWLIFIFFEVLLLKCFKVKRNLIMSYEVYTIHF